MVSCLLFLSACVLLLRWNERERPLEGAAEQTAERAVSVTAADVGALTPYAPSEEDPLDPARDRGDTGRPYPRLAGGTRQI